VVGYSGGIQPDPTYRNIKDHTEAVLIEYDPNVVSYDELLVEWSRMHNPNRKGTKRQYRSAVWYLDDEQREAADEVVAGMKAARNSGELFTSVEPATKFYRAEEYHQDFVAKQGMGG